MTEIECDDDNCIARNIGYHKCDPDCKCKCGLGVHADDYLHIRLQWKIDEFVKDWKIRDVVLKENLKQTEIIKTEIIKDLEKMIEITNNGFGKNEQ